VRRDEILKSLGEVGISTDLLNKVKNAYEKTIDCVNMSMGWSSWF
jgi:hypothetical protein